MQGGLMNMAIRIAFLPPLDENWIGGVNYYLNLFKIIKEQSQNSVECVALLSCKTSEALVIKYSQYADIILAPLRTKWNVWWFLKIFGKPLGLSIWKYFLKKHTIDIVSHNMKYENFGVPNIGWIPDFQHLHLPEFFNEKEIKKRNKIIKQLITKCDGVIFSSEAALQDCKAFIGYTSVRFHVLRFATSNIQLPTDKNHFMATIEKFKLPAKYFHISNQFWAHKNHGLVFEAVKCIKETGVDIYVVCTGLLEDNRNPNYVSLLKKYILENNLENNIRLLGVVEYDEMVAILVKSFTVINPSLFEGWSTIVEECKSIDHPIILSDIKVHREQKPRICRYFNANSLQSLIDVMLDVWNNGWEKDSLRDYNFSNKEDFYNNFFRIIKNHLKKEAKFVNN
jgi:glycosyltransferase involved in cell wall biosynthesis